jgi:hypothetical protein
MPGKCVSRKGPRTTTATFWSCPRCGAKLLTRNLSHACGDYSIEKFLAATTDAGRDSIDVHFVLPRIIVSPRFRKVEQLGKLYVHHLRLGDPRDFNRELAGWLRQSYREYGQRAWLTDAEGDSNRAY